MKQSIRSKAIIVDIVCYLFILLFVYAALSKLIDFDNFRVQLGQSPMLNPLVDWIVWAVPLSEIVIAILLLVPRFRIAGLMASFFLMMAFSAYIFTTINFSEHIPCSCGGILEDMTWNQHLVFNLIFCALAVLATLCYVPVSMATNRIQSRDSLLFMSGLTCVAFLIIGVLFRFQATMPQDDSFARIFQNHLYLKTAEKKLKYQGYYFAGSADGTLYLGNSSSPLSVLATDSILNKFRSYKISLDKYDLPFRSATLRVSAPYFYLADGTVPAVFQGTLDEWDAKQIHGFNSRFSAFEVADSSTVLFRSKSPKTKEFILGKFHRQSLTWDIAYGNHLLQRQMDGIFDSDGMMHYNKELNALLYLYYYRNQYVVADINLELQYRAHTIDTNSQAKIQVASMQSGQRKLSAPARIINNYSCTAGNKLFINSNLRSRSETVRKWKESAVVDVYNLVTKKYEHSFVVHTGTGKNLHGMYATATRIYFLIDDLLVTYQY